MTYTFTTPTRFAGGHLHSIGNRCWCGYLAVPVRFHTRNDKGEVVEDGKAEKRYFDYLGTNPPGVDPPCMAEALHKTVTQPRVTQSTGADLCNTCGKEKKGRGKVCNACRQSAYRERKA